MRIAFDATVLHGRKSGVGYYCEELLRQLARDHETDFFVFSHLPLKLDLPHANGNIRYSGSPHCRVRALYLHTMLPRILSRERPDLCHYTNFLAPVVETRPYVVTIHDMGLEALRGCHPLAKRLYTRNLIPRVAHGARLILTNSEFSKWEIVRGLGIPEQRIRVTPLAASPEFRPGVSTSARSRPYFLFVGNIEPRKNLSRLIEAFTLLRNSDCDLWIAGNNWYRSKEVFDRVRELGLQDRVRFLGYVPREDLPGLYGGATAFIYPSLLEGFGLPVVEAMACGAPVITSNNSSLKEVAGDAAILINPLNVDDMARAMKRLLESESDRREFSRRGLERASLFSWEQTAALTLEAYRDAATGSAPIALPTQPSDNEVSAAIRKTVAYAALFDYPLKPEEIHERLFDVAVRREVFDRVLQALELTATGGFVCDQPELVAGRERHEETTERAVTSAWPRLRSVASIPFVRMMAFSGATAHRNMDSTEDLDLFLVVEEGKLWFAYLTAMIWSKVHRLRRKLCMNYAISDAALPLFDRDPFTAQQLASLKPFYGKDCYDRLLDANPFVVRRFPNFTVAHHREMYPEIKASRMKRVLEVLLGLGPVWFLERVSRRLLGWHFGRKIRQHQSSGVAHDVSIDSRRLKLHFHDHKRHILTKL